MKREERRALRDLALRHLPAVQPAAPTESVTERRVRREARRQLGLPEDTTTGAYLPQSDKRRV